MAAPGFIQGITSLFGKERDPAEEQQRVIQMLMRLFSPQKIGQQANEMYGVLKGSPMYQQSLNNLIGGAQRSSNMLTRNLAGAGIQGSGVGQIQRSMAPSVMAGGIGNLNSSTYGMGLDSIMQQISAMMGSAVRTPQRTSGIQGLRGFAQGLENTDWRWALDAFNKRNQGGPRPGSTMGSPGWKYPVGGQPGF
jgi:hypothetical protein